MREDSPNTLYSFEVVNQAGSLLAILDKAKHRTFSVIRNRPGFASFALSVDDPKATSEILKPGVNEIRIKRGNRYLWGGQIARTEAHLQAESGLIYVTVHGFLDLLRHRFTGSSRTFTAIDAGTIASTLVDESQKTSGSYDTKKDLGIRAGTIQTSVNRDRTYEYKEIKEALIQLSEVKQGFDFEITYDKKLNVWYPRQGGEKPELIFRYPGNVQRLALPTDADEIANQVIARGSGFGASQPITTRDEAPSQDGYKLRQRIVDYPDISEVTTLEQHADEILRTDSVPLQIPELTLFGNQNPHIGDFWIGDSVRIKAKKGLVDIDNFYRVDQITVGVTDDDVETVSLRMSL